MELDDCEWMTSPEQKRTQDFLSLQNEKKNTTTTKKKKTEKWKPVTMW